MILLYIKTQKRIFNIIIKLLFCLLIFFRTNFLNAQNDISFIKTNINISADDAIYYLTTAYPNSIKQSGFDENKMLFYIIVQNPKNTQKLFFKNGSLLPESELNKNITYEEIFSYKYPDTIPNPLNFTSEQKKQILEIAEKTHERTHQLKSQTFLLNALYYGENEKEVRKQIVKIKFLNKTVNIHKDISIPLKNVETKIIEAAKTNSKIQTFLNDIYSISGFNWRDIRSSENRSTHSWGISIDIMPILRNKQIYWEWTKVYAKNKWVDTPLKNRWIPPLEVIQAFESEGFIWGGKWEIWDNMHFEYRPEILLIK